MTPEQYAAQVRFAHSSFSDAINNAAHAHNLELFRQAMQQARDEALEEAAGILDAFQAKCLDNNAPEKAFEHGLTASDIRALKNKES